MRAKLILMKTEREREREEFLSYKNRNRESFSRLFLWPPAPPCRLELSCGGIPISKSAFVWKMKNEKWKMDWVSRVVGLAWPKYRPQTGTGHWRWNWNPGYSVYHQQQIFRAHWSGQGSSYSGRLKAINFIDLLYVLSFLLGSNMRFFFFSLLDHTSCIYSTCYLLFTLTSVL